MANDIFDAEIATSYDETTANMFAPEVVGPAVDVLVEFAGRGSALEFASGTGRIALPLAERGVPVQGIELSEAMAAEMARKPGADGPQRTSTPVVTSSSRPACRSSNDSSPANGSSRSR